MIHIPLAVIAFAATVCLAIGEVLLFYHKSGENKICLSCHEGIEEVSENHKFPCAECHTDSIEYAHSGNDLDAVCGKCHAYWLNAVSGSVMFTNSGIIKGIGLVWEEAGEDMPVKLYEKYCSVCHISSHFTIGGGAHRSSGCATCHTTYNRSGSYDGSDKRIKGKRPYPETHSLLKLPTDERCAVCHNRGGRIAFTYSGLYDGNNSLVPTQNGGAGPIMASDRRNVRNMVPDIHSAGDIECIDCHTQVEVMGDGQRYEDMFQQTEIGCESCHGDGESLPKSGAVDSYTTELRLNYAKSPPADSVPLTTRKGRVLPNVFKQNGRYWLLTKRNGGLKEIKTIKDTPEHKVAGHERLDCISCHSKVIAQCYSCHIRYDERDYSVSYLTGEISPGAFSETEDIRLFHPFPLAVNRFGKITPVTPGRQSLFTHIDAEGKVIKEERLLKYRGENRNNPKFAPFFGHNLGGKAIGCSECHGNPYFYGFGDGLFSTKDGGEFVSPLIDDTSGKPLAALYSISGGRLDPTCSVVGGEASMFTREEIIRIIDVNRCIVCHDNPKYFTEKRDYEKILSDSIHLSLIR